MNKVISHLDPQEVFSWFEVLSSIPRGSSHEEKVSNWFVQFAEERGLAVSQDSHYSICMKVPGTPGYEDAPPVILHGHMDMVCKKNDGVEHDFLNDGLDLRIEDGYIRANGTTLGADNGIGLAYFLALVDAKDIPHPPLELAITVMEEMGKVGGDNFDTTQLTGKRMIDLNWHKDDYLLAGCGGDVTVKYDVIIEKEAAAAGTSLYQLDVDGLLGGHCEFDIVLERANSIIVLARILNNLRLAVPGIRAAAVSGGVQNNVIPGEAQAVLAIADTDVEVAEKVVADTFAELKEEYAITDPGISVRLTKTEENAESVYTDRTLQLLVGSILLLPNGVISMSFKIEGISECSSNLGLMQVEDDRVSMYATITSSVTTRKHEVMKQMIALADLLGDQVHAEQFGTDAPEWIYNPDSLMLAKAKAAYKKVTGEDANIEVMPASLELGLFQGRIPGLDIISIGTVTHGVHTPGEELEIKSVSKVWAIFKELMASLKE